MVSWKIRFDQWPSFLHNTTQDRLFLMFWLFLIFLLMPLGEYHLSHSYTILRKSVLDWSNTRPISSLHIVRKKQPAITHLRTHHWMFVHHVFFRSFSWHQDPVRQRRALWDVMKDFLFRQVPIKYEYTQQMLINRLNKKFYFQALRCLKEIFEPRFQLPSLEWAKPTHPSN